MNLVADHYATNDLVASASPIAAAAGLKILHASGRGHHLASLGNNAASRIQLILLGPDGAFNGANDPRGSGITLAY